MKKVLILGGTGFTGRLLTEKLIKTDADITIFNRGKTNPGIFPQVTHIKGDRNTDDVLQVVNNDWDTVVDFTGFFPDNVEMLANLLEGKAGRYIFISTGNVYPMETMQQLNGPIDEFVETETCTPEQRANKDTVNFYGNKKAECERILLSLDWLDTIIFRPSLIYGKYDPTDRFYYWLYRVRKRDRILLPEGGKTRFTNTFSEDLANIILAAIDIKEHGKVYNASTHDPVSIKQLIETVSGQMNMSPELVSALPEFLEKHNVQQWQDLPVWISGFDMLFDNGKLKKDFGTLLSSFENSMERTISYYEDEGWKVPRYGLTTAAEDELMGLIKD